MKNKMLQSHHCIIVIYTELLTQKLKVDVNVTGSVICSLAVLVHFPCYNFEYITQQYFPPAQETEPYSISITLYLQTLTPVTSLLFSCQQTLQEGSLCQANLCFLS